MTIACAVCNGVNPDVKFSGDHRTCNKCRNFKSRNYRAEYGRKRRAAQSDTDRKVHAERTRKYRAEKPHLIFHMTSRYQAKKAGVFSDLTPDDALSIYEAPNDCAYCGVSIDITVKRALHIDHVIPMSQGGPNSRWNLVKSCISCNSSKDDKSLVDFRSRTADLTPDRYESVITEMARLANRSIAEINELITQSHDFEIAFNRERQRMLDAINNFNGREAALCAI